MPFLLLFVGSEIKDFFSLLLEKREFSYEGVLKKGEKRAQKKEEKSKIFKYFFKSQNLLFHEYF